MAASTRWRHASQSRIAGSGGILPPTDTVFLYTPVDSPGCTPSRRGHGLLPRLQTGKQRPQRFAGLQHCRPKTAVLDGSDEDKLWFDPFLMVACSPRSRILHSSSQARWRLIVTEISASRPPASSVQAESSGTDSTAMPVGSYNPVINEGSDDDTVPGVLPSVYSATPPPPSPLFRIVTNSSDPDAANWLSSLASTVSRFAFTGVPLRLYSPTADNPLNPLFTDTKI